MLLSNRKAQLLANKKIPRIINACYLHAVQINIAILNIDQQFLPRGCAYSLLGVVNPET